jgi:hypothetical protein
MEATQRETESSNLASLLSYVLKMLKQPVSEDIQLAIGDYYGNLGMVDKWTAQLCKLLHSFDDEQTETIIYNARNAKSRALADWWERHQEWDRKREAQEEAKKEKDLRNKELGKIKKQALAKLTKEEKEALGLKGR